MTDIDKANALDWLNEIATNPKGWRMFYSDSETKYCVETAIALLKEQEEEIENLKQTAQSMMEGICLLKEQEAKTGHWIDTTKVIGFPRVQCSVCGSGQGAIWMHHCPNCGAKMEGV